MIDKDLTQQDSTALTRTDLTATEIKAALNQYLRMLKDAGMATMPKGMGHFNFAFATSEVVADELLTAKVPSAGSVPSTDQISPTEKVLSKNSVDLAKEAHATYVSNTGYSSPMAISDVPAARVPASSATNQGRLIESGPGDPSTVDRTPYAASLPASRRQEELQVLESTVSGCTKCAELSRCRNRVVFGVGNMAPRLVFLGEAPGADEDRQGEPFVGAAGQLLNKIIGACKLSRSEVYILNTIKCRPPGNRIPVQVELDNCWEFTQRQLEILRPEYICCLGLIATKQLLKTTLPLGQLRQKFHFYRDSRVVVTYHPAYLLRTESAKKNVWEDMQMLMSEMGRPPADLR